MYMFLIHFFVILTIFSCKGEPSHPTSDLDNVIVDYKQSPSDQENVKEARRVEPTIETSNEEIDVNPKTPGTKSTIANNSKSKAIDTDDQKNSLSDDKEQLQTSDENLHKTEAPALDNIVKNNQTEEEIKVTPEIDIQIKVKDEEMGILLSHDIWDGLLNKYVDQNGKVDYAGLKNERKALNEYLSILASNAPQTSWSKPKTMAYWINAYNAHTVDLILQNYPVSSITDLDNGNPWEVKRIKIGDQTYSLNNIEHDILRKNYKDARIHFAVNCAAKSCPKLHNEAWTEQNLEKNLERLTKSFVNNPISNKITSNKIVLSKIFEWYMMDFGDIISFLNKYSTTKISDKAKISFIDYDWQLNK